MKVIGSVFLLLLVVISQRTFAQNYKDSLDEKLSQVYQQLKVPGFTALIVNEDGIVYQKSLGYADIKTKRAFSEETIESLGSVSKTFVAVALMKAIELGYFTLETDVNDILPFKIVSPFYPNGKISIRHLVTHTSGIIDNDSIYNRSYLFERGGPKDEKVSAFLKERGYTGGLKDTTLSSFLHSYLNKKGRLYTAKNFSNSKPGQRSSYSNIGSALAAYLIEVKAAEPFSAFCRRYVFDPLGMKESKWFLSELSMEKHATPYFDLQSAFPFYSLTTFPDGGLRTSGADLSKYVIEMIRSLNGKPSVLDKRSIGVMFTPQFSANHLPENLSLTTRNKGVLWNLYADGFIGHDGDDPGVSTNILFNKSYGIIFMTNIYMEDKSEYLNVLKEYASKMHRK
jgi:CubicO group peptidase (beta-lactamase class C family)